LGKGGPLAADFVAFGTFPERLELRSWMRGLTNNEGFFRTMKCIHY